ncbi:MAG: hypothetical protein EOP04_20300 [Proteobacteria bacterium]|nr:MAG: hypothetical protein EOP04_20300 [Pseudomonadota bacterium]
MSKTSVKKGEHPPARVFDLFADRQENSSYLDSIIKKLESNISKLVFLDPIDFNMNAGFDWKTLEF